MQQSLQAIRQLEAQLEEKKVIGSADKYKPSGNPSPSHVRYPLEGASLFQDPSSWKDMVLDDVLAHKKYPEQRIDHEVEKQWMKLPSDQQLLVDGGQKGELKHIKLSMSKMKSALCLYDFLNKQRELQEHFATLVWMTCQ